MPITGQGWELLVKRLGLQTRGGVTRTYATYQAFRDGVASADLSGHLCECKGPGDNEHPGSGKRIKAGKYPLSTQFGRKYKTSGFGTGASGDASERRAHRDSDPSRPPANTLSVEHRLPQPDQAAACAQ